MTTGPKDPTIPSSNDAATMELHAEEAYCSACNQSFPSDTRVCPNDGARLIKLAAQRDDLIGRVLDERYEIRAPLGKGGMGTVYRGWQLSVDREVAIKVIHPKLSNDRSAVKRFLREARLASRLSQPNIVNVYDFGQSGTVLYLVMELLRGHTLSAELAQGRRINAKRTITIASQLCDALEAAHAQGIVHRDLKPSNIVILDDPPGRDLIKVLDFGLAKSLIQDSGSVVTNTDALLGTPLYMAPEQIEGKVSDQRADLYSLGCILYEMLSGKPPFVDNAVSAVLARHMNDTHAGLPSHIPSSLRKVIDKLLSKTPEGRIQTAGEVRKVLEDVRDSAPNIGTSATVPHLPAIPDAPDTIPDVPPAMAETLAATPTPSGMVIQRKPGPGGAVAVSVGTSIPPTGSKGRRYAIITLVAIVPLAAIAFVMFNTMKTSQQATKDHAAEPRGSDVSGATADAAVQQPLADPPPVVDAGVDAPAATIPSDAGVKKRPERGGDRPRPPKTTPDAGAPANNQTLPDIDFIDINKKKPGQ